MSLEILERPETLEDVKRIEAEQAEADARRVADAEVEYRQLLRAYRAGERPPILKCLRTLNRTAIDFEADLAILAEDARLADLAIGVAIDPVTCQMRDAELWRDAEEKGKRIKALEDEMMQVIPLKILAAQNAEIDAKRKHNLRVDEACTATADRQQLRRQHSRVFGTEQ